MVWLQLTLDMKGMEYYSLPYYPVASPDYARSQLGENVISEMKAVTNSPNNLAIVPVHVRDSVSKAVLNWELYSFICALLI